MRERKILIDEILDIGPNYLRQDELPSVCYMKHLVWDIPENKYSRPHPPFSLSLDASELFPSFAGGLGLAHTRPAL